MVQFAVKPPERRKGRICPTGLPPKDLQMDSGDPGIHSSGMKVGERTRCPYTLKPLAELANASREHVVLDALGGPNAYAVTACQVVNNQLGQSVDAAFLKEPAVAIARTREGIQTRNGESTWRMNGKTVEGDRPVQVTFSGSSVEVYHEKPVEKSERESGVSYQIIAPESQAAEQIERLKKKLARKGMVFFEPEVRRTEDQTIRGQLVMHLDVLEAGLMKIAYLACFEMLGDAFLDDPLNEEWQKLIRGGTMEERKAIRITRGIHPQETGPFAQGLLPKLEPHQHGIAIVNFNHGLYVIVRLFGDPLLTAFARVSETSDFGLEEAGGKLVVIDAITKRATQEPWINHLLRLAGEPVDAMTDQEEPDVS